MLRKHYDLYDFLLWDVASVLADIGAHIVGVSRIGEAQRTEQRSCRADRTGFLGRDVPLPSSYGCG